MTMHVKHSYKPQCSELLNLVIAGDDVSTRGQDTGKRTT